MLQTIRDRAQGVLAWIIVGLISVPFALWGIHHYGSPSQKDIVAEVNGTELSTRDFQREVRRRQQQLQALTRGNIDLSFMEEQIRQSTLDNMIEDIVITQTAVDQGLRVGNSLLAQYIHNVKEFAEDGVFSQARYEMMLQNQGLTPVSFEREQRQAMLLEQVNTGIVDSTFLTDYEQAQRLRLEKQQRFVSYLIVPFERFVEDITITDAEIETHYKAHQADYMTAEKVSVEYVELLQDELAKTQTVNEETLKQLYQERLASFTEPEQWHARHILLNVAADAPPKQVQAVEQKAQELITKIQDGQDFTAVAEEFSDDTESAKQGGDLGWFGTGEMVKPFEDKVKSMQINAVSEPVKTQYGFHIIQLLEHKPETTKPLAEVRDALVEIVQREKAEALFNSQVDQFATLAFEHAETLAVVAETLGLEVKTTPLFDRQGIEGNDVFTDAKVLKQAFSEQVLKEGYNSEVIGIDNRHVVVLRLKDHEPAKPKPLAEVKDTIVKTLTQEKAEAAAQTLAETLLQKIQQGQDPDEVATAEDLSWAAAQWLERQTPKFEHEAIVETVFKMGHPETGKAHYQQVQLQNRDRALVALLAVQEKTEETLAAQQLERYQAVRGRNDFNQFVEALKTEAEIKIHSNNL